MRCICIEGVDITEWIFDLFHLNCTPFRFNAYIVQRIQSISFGNPHSLHWCERDRKRVREGARERIGLDETRKNLFAYKLKPIITIRVYIRKIFFFGIFAESQIIYSCMSAHHSFTHKHSSPRLFAACSLQFALLIADIYANKAVHSDSEPSKKWNKIQWIPITKNRLKHLSTVLCVRERAGGCL